jgi:hypothetical protein
MSGRDCATPARNAPAGAPNASSPHGRLGQCRPMTRGLKFGRCRARRRSAAHAAMAGGGAVIRDRHEGDPLAERWAPGQPTASGVGGEGTRVFINCGIKPAGKVPCNCFFENAKARAVAPARRVTPGGGPLATGRSRGGPRPSIQGKQNRDATETKRNARRKARLSIDLRKCVSGSQTPSLVARCQAGGSTSPTGQHILGTWARLVAPGLFCLTTAGRVVDSGLVCPG